MDRARVQRVLDKLNDVRQAGGGWEAACPCHEDRKPSLSITEKPDRLLLHCFAGCENEDIVAAIGLRMADLFDGTGQQPGNSHGREIAATYDYTDEAGRLLFQAVRYRPKGFAQRRPDGTGGWEWNMKGARRVLYRLPQVMEAAARGHRVHVVEGEKDVHALETLGQVATTNAGGAGKWHEEYAAALRGAHVVLLPDNDPPGRSARGNGRSFLQGTGGEREGRRTLWPSRKG